MMTLDLSPIQAVDVHCHPYLQQTSPLSPAEFVRKLSLSVVPGMFQTVERGHPKRPVPGTNMYTQITIQRLAAYFGCDPVLEEVVAWRNRQASDPRAYTRALFRDANIAGLLLDFGYPQPRLSGQAYADMTGVPYWEVYRIEPVMVRLRDECGEFGSFAERYRADLREALRGERILGLKTIIAYRSGLEIGPMDEQAAAEEYAAFCSDPRAAVKALRDYCLHVALEECTAADKAMHIHTGVGDGEVVLTKANPACLLDLLRDKKYIDTKVHLVHGGYPWVEEAAFIVSVLPRVYLDISLQNPFIGHGVERILSHVFEFAPFSKVMYGSDAFTLPEMNWLGVHLFKECFTRVLEGWIARDYMDADVALHIAEGVLYRNFTEVYEIAW
ncbi:amidohydrolase family protein [Brevibacillus sp. LEMMJ03]|uniref:amidohydrolase family protein n=1 Tax=Brevibacillus sp. LEMMJ03 TaxID=2595056 RepID=UPI00117BE309|nr:amidohydrolase family protein [Brevibacillus sp. LEMMJ03]TRY25471.1 amidohydrolase family protein [Brevibacillus sp. LEMMJ03]